MARSWRDAFDLGEAGAEGDQAAGRGEEAAAPEGGGGLFRRLRESLSKSRQALTAELGASLFENLDEEAWERLE